MTTYLIRSDLLRGLRRVRFDPDNLSAIENLRWKNVLKYQDLLNNSWKRLFTLVPPGGLFYGVCTVWVKDTHKGDHYEQHNICFHTDGFGIGFDHLAEDDSSAIKFVRCLPEDKLALYINSHSEKVREAVKGRLEGKEDFEAIPLRQDLVDMYYDFERKSQRLNSSTGYCDKVILEHFSTLSSRIHSRYESPIITLSINGRVYICKGREFILKPETKNYMFSVSDLTDEGPVKDSSLNDFQLTVIKKEI